MQKVIIALLILMSILIYFVWGRLKVSYDSGPSISLGIATLDGGYSDILAWLLGIIIPVSLSIALGLVSKKWSLVWRIILPFLLCVTVVGLNLFIGVRIINQQSQDNDYYACDYIDFNGTQELACPVTK